jgi:pimeloyl-ACP methyl ester carboxylesterase
LTVLGRDRLREHWTTIDGQRIFARVSTLPAGNAGTPLVLVHGLGVSSRYMVPLARELAPFYPTFALDLPGFGRSPRTRRVPGIRELAGWLHRWMEAMQLVRPVFIANSMGAQIVVELAGLAPNSLCGAILLGPTMDPSGGVFGQVGRLLMNAFREPFRLVPLLAFDYLRNGPIRTIFTFREAVRHRMLERMPLLHVPTLILRGERDPIVSDWFVRELARRMPLAQVDTVAGAGHALNYNSPSEIARRVYRFLETHRAENGI